MNARMLMPMLSLLLLVFSATSVRADNLTLVEDGKPKVRIILPAVTEFEAAYRKAMDALETKLRKENPDADEKQMARIKRRPVGLLKRQFTVGDEEAKAAEELQEFIEKISGAKPAIERAEGDKLPPGPCVLLGAQLAREAGVGTELDKLHKDGLLCRVRGDRLILSGKRARGTLYAVYSFLETLGCRWVLPGEFGEIYPSTKTVETSIDLVDTPSHGQRYFWCTYGHAEGYKEWTLRNKGNFVMALGDVRVHQGHALSGPLRWGAKQEPYRIKAVRPTRVRKKDENGKPYWAVEKKEVWTLPDEYYAMVKGKPNTHIPNMANPKVWDLYAEYYINWFNERPNEEYVSMSAEDGLVLDDRAESRRLESKDFDFAMGAFSATDKLWFFLNRVIEKVVRVHPDKKFGVLVYSNNLMPPRLERVHPNMALVFAPLGVSPLHHVRDPKSKTNTHYRRWLEDWMIMAEAAGAETYYYDYEPMGYCWNMAMICPRWGIIGKNYPWFHEMGLDGHTTQGYDDWASCGMDNYLMQRLYWNIDKPYKEIMADYARARFGAGAPAMLEYYDILEKRMGEIPDLYSNELWDNHLILTPEVRAECRKILQKAINAADTDRAKAHVGTMVDLQRSTDAMCDAIEHQRKTGDFGKAAEMMQPCFDIAAKLQKLYPNFMNSTRLDPERKTLFFSGGLRNQYKRLGQKIENSKAKMVLPRYWQGMLDTRNHAISLGLHLPEKSVDHLEQLDITVCPDVKYQTQREVAAFFYRTQVDVPADFKDKKITILFPGLIAKGFQMWVNGKPVMFDQGTYKETIWRGPDYFWMNYNHEREFDVTDYVQPGKRTTIVLRVFKSFDFGGSYRRVWLLGN